MSKMRIVRGVVGLATLGSTLGGAAVAQESSGTAPAAAAGELSPTAPPATAGQPPQAGGTPATVQEIVVTGSRIVRRDYAADSPIVTVQQQALQNLSPVTIDNALQKLPQFTGIAGQAATGSGFGMTGAATLNLRNLGDNRNLVLLDGRRMQPATTDFAVDVNSIPSALIENVEVITGGASAVYGSDAIAGVINFRLKHDFSGVEVDLKQGVSQRGQYGNFDGSILAGANFADDRGNVVVSLDYTKRDATYQNDLPFYQRAFAAGSGSFALSFLDLGYYQPELDTFSPAPGVNVPNWPGFPAAGPAEKGFNSDHTTYFDIATAAGYNSGVYPNNAYYAINNGVKYNANYNEYATTPLQRYSGFGRFEYKLTDDISVYGQMLYTHYDVKNAFIPLPAANSWAVDIPRDALHPVPASFAALLNARPVPTLPWHYGRSLSLLGQPITNNSNDTYQAIVGASGSFADRRWTWDIYGSHGNSKIDSTGDQGYALWSRYNALIQAPNYGAGYTAGGSSPICTSGISPFIAQSAISADCIKYLTYRYVNQIHQKQDVVEGDLQGKIADLPAGELRVALGADYRKNTLESDVDPAFNSYYPLDPNGTASNIVGNFSANSSAGSSSLWELYGEILVPILKDKPFVKSFDIDAAYRYSNYQLSGGVNTYKADANWAVNDFLRFRGGYQRAVRAPNVTELFSSKQSSIVIGAQDPCVNAGPFATPPGNYGNNSANPDLAKVRALCAAITPSPNAGLYNAYTGSGTPVLIGQYSGNPNLKPEKADTYTAGVILTPHGLPFGSRLSASLDYYNINVTGAIAALDPNQIYQLCFNFFGTNPNYDANNAACGIIIRAPGNGLPQGDNAAFQNEGGIKTQGIDAQIDWALPVAGGTLDINAVASYLLDYKISFAPGVPFVDYADTISSNEAYFRWRSLITTTYANGPFSLGLRWKHLPAVRDYSCTSSCTSPSTTHYNLFDLFGTVAVTKDVHMVAGIDNLFDRDPPVVGGVLGNTNVGEYDVVGRQFYVSMKAKF